MSLVNGVYPDQCFPDIIPVPPGPVSEQTIRLSLFIFSPISFALGSPGLWFSQPITQATVPLSSFWVLVINIIIEIVTLFSQKQLSVCPGDSRVEGPPGSITTTLPELIAFLKQLQKGQIQVPVNHNTPKQVPSPGVRIEKPNWFTVFLLLSGHFEPGEKTPRASLFLPVFEVKGITGGLPIIIIGLIATILIRHVVPPSSSGVRPPREPEEDPKFEFGLREILTLLKGYNHLFK